MAKASSTSVTGPEEIFEGGVGWRHAVAGEVDFAALVRPVDGHYRIMVPFTSVAPAMEAREPAPITLDWGLPPRSATVLATILAGSLSIPP
jgi:hypothetical protein